MHLKLRFVIGLILISFAVSAQYCVTGVGPSTTFDTDIESVSMIGDNFSINNSNTCPGTSGVLDRTTIDSADVSLGTSYSVQVVLGTCNGGAAYYTSVAEAWVDWNQDGTFDATESIGSANAPNTSQPQSSAFSFTVPANAVLGETRMRIANVETGTLPLLPCAAFTYGAVEDYKFVVTNTPPACPSPSIAQLVSIDDVSATVFWSSTGTSFNYEWGPFGFSQGTGTTGNTNNDTLSLTGLSPETEYSFYVQNDCSASGSGTSQWVGPFNFTTLCTGVAAPFAENFDAIPNGTSIIGCWQVFENNPGFLTATAQVVDGVTGPTPNTAPHQLQFFNGFSTNCYLVSPLMIGLDQNLYQFQFAVNDGGNPLTFQIGTQASPSDTAGFTSLVTITTNGSYSPQTVYLVGIPAGDNHISIKHNTSLTFENLYFDDISYDVVPSCIPPVGVNIGALATTADINFNFTGGTQVNYEWGPFGFSQGTGTSGTSSSNPINITGLSPNTTYSVYLQGDCGGSGLSPWAGPFNFTTPCITAALPYMQAFDAWPPVCMSETGGSQQWLHFGNDYARANFWGWTNGQTALLTTEPIFIDQDAQVSFEWSHQHQTFYPDDRLTIRASIAGSAIWDTLVNLSGPTFNTPNSAATTPGDFALELVYLDAAIYTGQNIVVQMFANSGFGPDVFVDNLLIEAVPACPNPSGLSVFNITANTADFSWIFGGTATNGWNIEWGPVGFSQGTGTSLPSPNDTISISGLTALTTYDFYVQQDCGSAGTSTWTGPLTFTTACAALIAPYFEDFETLPQGPGAFLDYGNCWTMPNVTTPRWETEDASGANENSTNTGPFYDHSTFGTAGGTYFYLETSGGALGSSNEITSADIDVSALTNPYVEFWYHMYGATMGSMAVDVWDANNSWTNDIITLVGQQQAAGSDPWNKIGATLPAGYTGVVRFRIRGIRGASFTGDASFDDFSVIEAPSCPDINSLATILAEGFQVNVGWNGQGGTNFNIEWGPAGFGQGSGTFLTSTVDSILITGLTPTTSYDIYVQNDCGAAGTSNWFGPLTITTTVTCPAPSAVTVAPATTTATFNWQTGGAADFNYILGPAGTTPATGTIMSGTGATVAVSSLTPSTQYTFWVRDSCGLGDVSTWTGPLDFNTLCVAASIPYLRDFNGANFPPLCWDLSGGTQTLIQNSGQYLEANFWGWPGGNWAPAMTEPITISQNARVKFNWAHLYSTTYPQDQMLLMVRLASSSTYDTLINKVGPTFTSLNATNTVPPAAGDFVQEIINLDPAIYTGQDVIFLFRFNSDFGPDVFIDNFIVEPLPACPEPTQPIVNSVSGFSANVSWTNGDPAAATWFVEYGPSGFTPGTGTVITASTNPVTISGLSPATSYQWFVSELCQNGIDTSNSSQISGFATLCAPITAPYVQTFTGTAAGIVGAVPPVTMANCWEIGGTTGGEQWQTEDASGANENSFGTGPWYDNTTPATTGGMYVYLETSTGVSSSGPAMFISPHIVISALTAPNLSFAYHMYGATMDSLRVDVFGNGVWNTGVFSLFGQQQTAGTDPWLSANVALTGYGDTVRVRFAGKRGTSFTGDMSLDDIRVDEAPACPNPTNLATVSSTTTDATVSWTPGSAAATTWFIEVGAPGFTIGTGTLSTATTSPYTIAGLNASSNYCFYVYELCTNGTDTSLAAGPVCFATQCASAAIPYLRDFNTWPPLCWDLTGGTQTYSQFNSDQLWANFWGWTSGQFAQSTTEPIVISQDAQVEFDWSHLYSATYPTDQLIVLAQVQGATTWDTIVNLIGTGFTTTGAGNTTPATTYSHMIAVLDPVVYTGQTVQLRMIANSGFGPDVFVDNFAVNPYSTCAAPTLVNATGVANSTAVLDWMAGSMAANTWFIEYGPNGFTPGTGVMVTSSSNPYTLTALNPGTAYCAFVSELCGGGDTSAYSAQVCFTTTGNPPSCATPSALASSNIGCISADISWTSITGSSVVQWGPSGFTPGAGTFVSTTSPYTLTGLTAGTSYDIYVADICPNGDTSLYTNVMMVMAASGPLPTIAYTYIQSSTTGVDATVDFDASASTNATSITWDFGNGSAATGPIGSATYTQNAPYSVTITATNDCGSVDSIFVVNVQGISIYEQTLLGATVKIYPNPTKSIVNVELEGDVNKDFSVELLNILGQPIQSKSISSTQGNADVSFDLSSLPKGVYMIRIQSGNAVVTKRVQRN